MHTNAFKVSANLGLKTSVLFFCFQIQSSSFTIIKLWNETCLNCVYNILTTCTWWRSLEPLHHSTWRGASLGRKKKKRKKKEEEERSKEKEELAIVFLPPCMKNVAVSFLPSKRPFLLFPEFQLYKRLGIYSYSTTCIIKAKALQGALQPSRSFSWPDFPCPRSQALALCRWTPHSFSYIFIVWLSSNWRHGLFVSERPM